MHWNNPRYSCTHHSWSGDLNHVSWRHCIPQAKVFIPWLLTYRRNGQMTFRIENHLAGLIDPFKPWILYSRFVDPIGDWLCCVRSKTTNIWTNKRFIFFFVSWRTPRVNTCHVGMHARAHINPHPYTQTHKRRCKWYWTCSIPVNICRTRARLLWHTTHSSEINQVDENDNDFLLFDPVISSA